MILNYSWAVWLAWILGTFFLINGLLNLAGFVPMRGVLLWSAHGDPARLAGGFFCIAAGLMVVWYPARPLGLLLGLVLCAAACLALVRRRDFAHLPLPALLAVIVLVTAWGLRLI